MPRKKRQEWNAGDYFLVPLNDGSAAFGQVLERELARQAMGAVICAFFDSRVGQAGEAIGECQILTESNVISAQFISPHYLNSGEWPVVGSGKALPVSNYFDMGPLRRRYLVGIKIYGVRNIAEFVNAYYGLHPWDAFAEPDYLDGLLISPSKKPPSVLLKSDLPEP